ADGRGLDPDPGPRAVGPLHHEVLAARDRVAKNPRHRRLREGDASAVGPVEAALAPRVLVSLAGSGIASPELRDTTVEGGDGTGGSRAHVDAERQRRHEAAGVGEQVFEGWGSPRGRGPWEHPRSIGSCREEARHLQRSWSEVNDGGKKRAREQLRTTLRTQVEPEGREGHARDEAWEAALRPLRQEGQEPQAGDRDRPFRGASRRWQGPLAPLVLARPAAQPALVVARGSFRGCAVLRWIDWRRRAP